MDTNLSYIYGLFDNTGIRYIGQSVEPRRRYSAHLRVLNERTHKCHWVKTILNSGETPTMTILEICSKASIDAREQFWISFGRKCGWNLVNQTAGGKAYGAISCDIKRRIRASNIGKHYWTDEMRAKQRAKYAGKPIAVPHRKKIAMALTGRSISEDDKINRRNRSTLGKAVLKLDPSTDVVLETYRSAREAARILRLYNSAISACCNGRSKTHGGFKWMFSSPEKDVL